MAKEEKKLDVYSPDLDSPKEEKEMFVKVINHYLPKDEQDK